MSNHAPAQKITVLRATMGRKRASRHLFPVRLWGKRWQAGLLTPQNAFARSGRNACENRGTQRHGLRLLPSFPSVAAGPYGISENFGPGFFLVAGNDAAPPLPPIARGQPTFISRPRRTPRFPPAMLPLSARHEKAGAPRRNTGRKHRAAPGGASCVENYESC